MEELNVMNGENNSTVNKDNIVKRENIYILTGAVILAVIFNVLFYRKDLGISYPIFVLTLYGVLIFTLRDKIVFKLNFETLLTVPIVLLSLTYMIFSNYLLLFLNFMIIPVLIVAQTLLITKNNCYE